jgi:general secretion pathway protein G
MFKLVRRRKAKGFTLVELLIVMVIIGILAGAMLLVMGSGKDKANATKIVSDMRSLKAAALMYYGDNNAWPTQISQLSQYMDRQINTNTVASYDISNTSTDYYVCVKADLSNAGEGVKKALAAMAEDSGLYDGTASNDSGYSGDNDAYMRISTQ